MINRIQPLSAPERQSGAALIVGLILMLVLTVLGVSGMTAAVFGLTMASNAEFEQNTFQAAENGIDYTLEHANLNTITTQNFPDAYSDGTYSATTQMSEQGTTLYLHRSFSVGEDEGTVVAYHYDIVSTATGPDGARSIHTQSFYVAGPPPGD